MIIDYNSRKTTQFSYSFEPVSQYAPLLPSPSFSRGGITTWTEKSWNPTPHLQGRSKWGISEQCWFGGKGERGSSDCSKAAPRTLSISLLRKVKWFWGLRMLKVHGDKFACTFLHVCIFMYVYLLNVRVWRGGGVSVGLLVDLQFNIRSAIVSSSLGKLDGSIYCIRLTLRCWGNSSIPEGRFSKWF